MFLVVLTEWLCHMPFYRLSLRFNKGLLCTNEIGVGHASINQTSCYLPLISVAIRKPESIMLRRIWWWVRSTLLIWDYAFIKVVTALRHGADRKPAFDPLDKVRLSRTSTTASLKHRRLLYPQQIITLSFGFCFQLISFKACISWFLPGLMKLVHNSLTRCLHVFEVTISSPHSSTLQTPKASI